MDEDRLRADLTALQNTSLWGDAQRVETDGIRGILLRNFPYPDGWQPERDAVLLEIPDAYPRQRPDLYVPKHMRYTAGPVTRVRRGGSTDHFWKWCIADLPWEGRGHDLGAFVASIRDSLENPDSRVPYADADDYTPQDTGTADASPTGRPTTDDSASVLSRLFDVSNSMPDSP